MGIMHTRPGFNEIWLTLADHVSKRSTCKRLQCGCVITTGSKLRVAAIGYNGTVHGQSHDECESEEEGGCGCIHAEMNAIAKVQEHGPFVAYLTNSPCLMCAKLLLNLGIIEFHYYTKYRDEEPIRYIQKILGMDRILQHERPGECAVSDPS